MKIGNVLQTFNTIPWCCSQSNPNLKYTLQYTNDKMYREHLRHSYSSHHSIVELEPTMLQQEKMLRIDSIFKCGEKMHVAFEIPCNNDTNTK